MNRRFGIFAVLACLVLALGAAPGWATQPDDIVVSDGAQNTAAGSDALLSLTTGDDNSAFGQSALASNTEGNHNTASGALALQANTTGEDNTALGTQGLSSNSTGSSNTALGVQALNQNSSGNNNTAGGANALADNTEGNENVAFGKFALSNNLTGNNNTAVGSDALENSTGNGNIAIGKNAGILLESGDSDIYIGNRGKDGDSGTIRIGKAIHTRTFIAGISGSAVGGTPVFIQPNGRLGIQASSARYKRDIRPIGNRTGDLMKLRPVTFRYKQDGERLLQYGLIAEEVAKVYPELVVRGGDGKVESVRYHELAPMLLNEVQRQERELAELRAQNEKLRAQNAAIMARLGRLEVASEAAAPLASR